MINKRNGPWPPVLETLFEQTNSVVRRAKRDMEFIHPDEDDEEQYLVREFSGKKKKWTDTYPVIEPVEPSYKITFPAEMSLKLQAKQKKPGIIPDRSKKPGSRTAADRSVPVCRYSAEKSQEFAEPGPVPGLYA